MSTETGIIKRRIPLCVQRLAKLASLASLPTVHVEHEILQEIVPLLSSYGASPDFVAPNIDNSGYYILYNRTIYFIQMQKKWELGSISDNPARHDVPAVAYKEQIENIAAFVTSTIDDDFVYLVHKDTDSTARSLSDTETRWLRFQSAEHVEEFIGHCLAMCAPQLLSKARVLMFQTNGAGSNFAGTLSNSEIAAETERLVAESERTIVVTDLVVRSVSDILTRVKEEVVNAMKKSASFSEKWGTKYNRIAALSVAMKQQGGSGSDSANSFGIRTCEYDFQHVGRNEKICARMHKAEERKVLFSSEAHLTDHTHEVAILTDKTLRIEKLRKDREVHVIPYNAVEEIVHEATPSSPSSSAALGDYSPKVLVKIDFSICPSIRGDILLRFPPGPPGMRMKNLFLASLTSAYESVVVSHLVVTESSDIFWARRGTLESQLVRMIRAIRPDEDDPRTQTQTFAASSPTTNPKLITQCRLALYLCLKQPHRVIAALSACSNGAEKRILAFMARTMHRIFLAHHEAVARHHELHKDEEHGDEYKNHGDLRCIPFVQPCVDYEVASYKFHRNRISETRERSMSFPANNSAANGSTTNYSDEYYSKSTADKTLLAPPSFGSSQCFASLALKEYIGTAGASFVSLCVGRPMEDFSSNPQTLQSVMSLQSKQHWASQFMKHLRGVVLGDGVDEVLPGAFKVVVSLIWQHFERDRQRPDGDYASTNGFDEVSVIGGFLFNQFLRPALTDPLGEGLISSELSDAQKKNLEDVTCLIECVLSQSDLPLATRLKSFSDGERRFLRRFIDNEVQDASRMLKSLIYPEIANDDPEDDGSAVPDFFPPPVPGEISFGTVELLPYGDPRTVESFWTRYVLKMPIDLHNLKLLFAFASGLKSISLQAITAAFTPQLHEHGMDLSLLTPSQPQHQVLSSSSHNQPHEGSPPSTASTAGTRTAKISLLQKRGGALSLGVVQQQQQSGTRSPDENGNNNNYNNNSVYNDDDNDNDELPSSDYGSRVGSPTSPRKFSGSVFWNPTSGGGGGGGGSTLSPSAMSASGGGPSQRGGAGAGGGRMRSSTLIRAESTAAERSAIADRTIHRLTLEVKTLKEQLAQAKQAELETRMAAARAMEQFSHSFAMQMTRTAAAAQRAQNKAGAKKSKNSSFPSPSPPHNSNSKSPRNKNKKSDKNKKKRRSSGDASSTASSTDSSSSNSSLSSDDDSNDDDNENENEIPHQNEFVLDQGSNKNASLSTRNSNNRDNVKNNNPFVDNSKTGINMSSILSPEARWRHSLQQLPAASRSQKGAGSETVFGCPMDAQCLAFLALPMTQSQHPQQGRSTVGQTAATSSSNNRNSNARTTGNGRTSPRNYQQQQPNNPLATTEFSNFSFIKN